MKKDSFTKKLSKSNLGLAKMNDKYITVPKNQVNPTYFFGIPPSNITCYDPLLDSYFTFPFTLQKNGEYRLSKFTAYFNAKNADPGDIIKITGKKSAGKPEHAYLIDLIKQVRTKPAIYLLTDEELVTDNLLEEGNMVRVAVNKYERNNDARDKCIKHWKAICLVCKLEFSQKYGKIGKGYINVHHLVPISQIGQSYFIDPINDLIPVCPNCHAMIHRRNPPYTIEDIRKMIRL